MKKFGTVARFISGKKIEKELNRSIFITPFDRKRLNPNSYNLTLDNTIIVYEDPILDMKEESENKEQKPTNVYQNNYNNDFITSSRIDIKA